MARWLDLPQELRVKILRYLFVGETVSHVKPSGKNPWLPDQPDRGQLLALKLVGGSFVHSDEIFSAAMPEMTLKVRSGYHLYSICQNRKYGPKPLCQLRRLLLGAMFEITLMTSLARFKSILPSLKQIRVEVYKSTFKSISTPGIEIPSGIVFDDKDKSDTGRQLWRGPWAINLDRFSLPIDSSRTLHDSAEAQHSSPTGLYNGAIYKPDVAFMISNAVSHVGPYTLWYRDDEEYSMSDSELYPARWLAQLLTDAVAEQNNVEIILEWCSQVKAINPLGQDITFIVSVSRTVFM